MNDSERPAQAFTLFCDDVRQEVGGKLSAMGIYQRVLMIPAEDVLLPKLVALTVLQLPQLDAGSTAQVQLWDRGELLSEAELNFEPPVADGIPTSPPEVASTTTVNIPLEMVPFRAQAGMALRLVYLSGDYKYESEPLYVINLSRCANS
jgi:hypothetical protein